MTIGLKVREELAGADLGDPRLVRRLGSIAESFAASPGASIPAAAGGVAEREAVYRFLSNPSVTLERVLAPHVSATVERARKAGRVFVVSDTTEFHFSSERRGLGVVAGKRRDGFLGHFALAVSADGEQLPLGVLAIKPIVRERRKPKRECYVRKRDGQRESLRWLQTAESTSSALGDVEAIHVMDREADAYELMAGLAANNRRFVIRSAQDRLLEDGTRLSQNIDAAAHVLEREVPVSSRPLHGAPERQRSHPARSARIARLRFAAQRIVIRKAKNSSDRTLPKTLAMNLVRVYEINPPKGQPAVEWRLFTTEPIDTPAEVAAIVDAYRTRWIIEEYFKALKTGCAYETRQLESAGTLMNALGIYAVVAWQLLLLRSLSRAQTTRPATEVLTPSQLEVLRFVDRRKLLPAKPSVQEAMFAIARLGGHITSNGPPGWLVLTRGFIQLLMAMNGYYAAKSIGCCDQS